MPDRRTDEFYDLEAEVYDILFSDFEEDLELIRKMAKQTGGPILDLMSGTGRITIPLAKEGYEVWGLDANAVMIARAKAKLSQESLYANPRCNLVKGDARSFDLGLRFPLILLTFNSFLHLHTAEDQEACLRNVARHLEPEGLFLVAFWNPDVSRSSGVMNPSKILRVGPEEELVWMGSGMTGFPERSSDVYYVYDLLGPEGDVRGRVGRSTFRLVFREEMEPLLRRCGLRVVKLMGGYDGRPFDEDSPMQIYLCRKADAKV